MTKRIPWTIRVVALYAMLVISDPALRQLMRQDDNIDVNANNIACGTSFRPNVKPFCFSTDSHQPTKLAIGQRTYKLPSITEFYLGPLIISYFDSAEIEHPSDCIDRNRLSNELYEPCIAAILIAIAQTNQSTAIEKANAVIVSYILFLKKL
ncbi:hypothetical protein F4678DRAFT_438857, partial [Xylaria arbuscula]